MWNYLNGQVIFQVLFCTKYNYFRFSITLSKTHDNEKEYTQNNKFLSKSASEWCTWTIRVFHDKEISHISVGSSDRSAVTQHKINSVKNCPQWGLNPKPPDQQSHALPTELGRNLLGKRFLKLALFLSCTTSHFGHCLFLESIEHYFIKALMIHTHNQIVT